MLKLIIFLTLFNIYIFGNNIKEIDKKINQTKDILTQKILLKKTTNYKISKLAEAIKQEEDRYNQIQYKLNSVSNVLFLNRLKLKKAKQNIIQIEAKTKDIQQNITKIEQQLVDDIVNKYSLSLGKELINKNSLKQMIEKEKYEIILNNTKDNILKSNLIYFKLSNDKRRNDLKTQQLKKYIKEQEEKKKQYLELEQKQKDSLAMLKLKYKLYQNKLQEIIDKQYSINNLLNKLKIVKNKKIKEEKLAKLAKQKARLKAKRLALKKKREEELAKKRKKELAKKKQLEQLKTKDIKIASREVFKDNVNLKVKNIGSSIKGIKVSKYKGAKTIAPLKSYTITKKFGKFYDPVYKIELFNASISLKSKVPNAKVYNILKGKIVYAKHNAGTLGNVVIVKHRNNLHTIYSQLSDIAPTLKQGRWIPKGYVVGRVKSTLVFQATKNNNYINPEKLFK